jgi:endogenous inhibitor of DNA gyrase (YacG/DUF329 family)
LGKITPETQVKRKNSYLVVKCGKCGKQTICGKIGKMCPYCYHSFEGVKLGEII